ncbi:MAG: tRNA lysidine(34) synthetase TilS [Chlamydiia bacterium]|nr:tRNA lysidine(34) synthetase TilS [Chlamydiia bacterium]
MEIRAVKDFLTLRLEKGAKLLLGISGGPDSMALLHLLLEAQKELDFSLHLAHVDHGWREESKKEGEILEKVAKYHKLPITIHRLEKMEGCDLENRAREARLAFFSQLQKEEGFQALLLGHHRGDQAETVFKRVAEGSHIKGLGGLYSVRRQGNLLIWRPLLPLDKETLLAYLKRKKVHYFEDRTNEDTSFLRARMRHELFPTVEKMFGKGMEKNCAKLGKLCQELAGYFEEKGERIRASLVRGPFGSYLDLNLGFHPLELQFFIRDLAPISSDALDVLMKLIERRAPSRKIHAHPYTFQLSRSHLFICREAFPNFFERGELWEKVEVGDWKTFWEGKIKMPHGEWEMRSLLELEPPLKRKMKKWYGSAKVPSFFYEKAPVFLKKGKAIADCLTGRDLPLTF